MLLSAVYQHRHLVQGPAVNPVGGQFGSPHAFLHLLKGQNSGYWASWLVIAFFADLSAYTCHYLKHTGIDTLQPWKFLAWSVLSIPTIPRRRKLFFTHVLQTMPILVFVK